MEGSRARTVFMSADACVTTARVGRWEVRGGVRLWSAPRRTAELGTSVRPTAYITSEESSIVSAVSELPRTRASPRTDRCRDRSARHLKRNQTEPAPCQTAFRLQKKCFPPSPSPSMSNTPQRS